MTPESDHYVAAAEVASAYEALQVPPCPLFAPSTICGRIALALAILFPDLVTSLAFVSLGSRSARRSIAQLVGFCELGVTGEDIVIEMFTELGEPFFHPLFKRSLPSTDALVTENSSLRRAAAAILGGQGQTAEERDDLVKFLLRVSERRGCTQSSQTAVETHTPLLVTARRSSQDSAVLRATRLVVLREPGIRLRSQAQ